MSVLCVVDDVEGVTQLHDVVFIVRSRYQRILRIDATTHQRLPDINVRGLKYPRDIAACEQTSRVYVADYDRIWPVPDFSGNLWPTSMVVTFTPYTLSVTSTRLLPW